LSHIHKIEIVCYQAIIVYRHIFVKWAIASDGALEDWTNGLHSVRKEIQVSVDARVYCIQRLSCGCAICMVVIVCCSDTVLWKATTTSCSGIARYICLIASYSSSCIANTRALVGHWTPSSVIFAKI
jgi:hypothetical protein